ncbi:MAG: hypothetical protein JWM11_582 [Planctomycetaceae bacterium]|nr:hypothetical protein [Planctomycetaceae bacterium]
MPDLLQETFLNEQQFVDLAAYAQPGFQRSELPKPAPELESASQFKFTIPRESRHWTKRLRDPLGDALARINSGNRSDLFVESVAATTKESGAIQSSDPVPLFQSEFPETLSMFAPASNTAVHSPIRNGQENRRKFPRRQSECRVTVVRRSETVGLTPQKIDWLLESGATHGRLQNLSQLGICLLLTHELPAETEVLLRIANEKLGRYVDVTAHVVRSQLTQSGTFSIHCRSLRDFTRDELQDLGQML